MSSRLQDCQKRYAELEQRYNALRMATAEQDDTRLFVEQVETLDDENARLHEENAELRRQLERRGDMARGFLHGADNVAAEYQRQRDEVLRRLDLYHSALVQGALDAENDELKTLQAVTEQVQLFEEQYGKYGAPLAVLWIQEAYTTYQKTALEDVNTLAMAIRERNGITPAEAVKRIRQLSTLSGARQAMFNALLNIRVVMNTPPLVCFELLNELLNFNKPYIQTVTRLDMAWVKINISPKIGTHGHLQTALEHAYKYRTQYVPKGGNTGVMYSMEYGISVEILRRYTGYLDNVVKHANTSPEDFKARYSDILSSFN